MKSSNGYHVWWAATVLSVSMLTACDTEPDEPPVLMLEDPPVVDMGQPDVVEPEPEVDLCEELGLTKVPFQMGAGSDWGELAGDFTATMLDGSTWTLSERWSGCDSYVFVNYVPSGYARMLWSGSLQELLEESPRNVHYFFTSYEGTRTAREASLRNMRQVFEAILEIEPEEVADHWRDRVHFVGSSTREIEGSVGELATNKGSEQFAFGIGRDQRFDPVGSLSVIRVGGFAPFFNTIGYAARYYNYRARLTEQLAAEADSVTVVPIMEEQGVTERILDRQVMLPADMSGFNKAEFDVTVECNLEPADCSEWDRIAYIHVCEDETCETRRQMVRWITPYSRPGRRQWVMDATSMLGLLRDGGERTFRVEMGPGWEEKTPRDVRIYLRLSQDDSLRDTSVEVLQAFTGGAFNEEYNAKYAEPFTFTPPIGTKRVEVVTIVSGHGQTMGDNCAEWCNHQHVFTVNDAEPITLEFPGQAGQPFGCGDLVDDGVIPGQYGNWAPLRAGWCPGYPVPTVRYDVTGDVVTGEENTLSYRGVFDGAEPRGGNISMVTYYR